jgi:hypothetical protein
MESMKFSRVLFNFFTVPGAHAALQNGVRFRGPGQRENQAQIFLKVLICTS